MIKYRCENGIWVDFYFIFFMVKYEDIKMIIFLFVKLKECVWFGDWC